MNEPQAVATGLFDVVNERTVACKRMGSIRNTVRPRHPPHDPEWREGCALCRERQFVEQRAVKLEFIDVRNPIEDFYTRARGTG